MMCKHVECHHYKVCMEWYLLGNENYINDSYGRCEHYYCPNCGAKMRGNDNG